MDIQFGNLSQLNWLWAVAAIGIVVTVALIRYRRNLNRFASPKLLGNLLPKGAGTRTIAATVLPLAAMALLSLALVDVRWGKTSREVPQKGIEVMFALDVSRSMLADDVSPNRLERAKQQIKDMVDEMSGDRVGLIVFAGDAKQEVPLTRHYHDFKETLDEVGPYNVQLGGSSLGNAIQTAADSFLNKTGNHRAIVVFTDGEDQESEPVKVAKQAYTDQGIRVFTVGLGDMEKGARIPVGQSAAGSRFLEHDGQQVWSKLDGKTLEQVAKVSNGAYVPAGTKQVDIANVYNQYIANVEQTEFETAKVKSYIPRFQYFAGPALALLLLNGLCIGGMPWSRN